MRCRWLFCLTNEASFCTNESLLHKAHVENDDHVYFHKYVDTSRLIKLYLTKFLSLPLANDHSVPQPDSFAFVACEVCFEHSPMVSAAELSAVVALGKDGSVPCRSLSPDHSQHVCLAVTNFANARSIWFRICRSSLARF